MKYKSKFLNILGKRGFLHQITDNDKLDEYLFNNKCVAYIGFDCTAPSLHVGSLIQIMMLRWFQKSGHKPIVLLGGGTTKIGDPSGKDQSRPLLDKKLIEKNKNELKKVFSKYLDFNDGSNKAILIDNEEWLDNLNYISFLRENGSHFSVNKLISLESMKLRLDRKQNLSFLEFNYPIFQAYDFFELNKNFKCRIQMGGSDQWGNIVNGIELIRKKTSNQCFGITSPLLTTSSGSKMGKTENGAIWLNDELLPDYDFWQFWRNTEDNDVSKFLKLFTELSLNKITELSNLKGVDINKAKIILANETTKLCRSEEAANRASQIAKDTFEKLKVNFDLPKITINKQSISLIEIVQIFKFCNSNGEVRRLIRGNGIKVNDKLVDDEKFILKKEDQEDPIKISIGKKKHGLVIFK
ncbi:MAG: tyrosine--tRNA ligase [SAR116 cluster bacterium]|nr:tyrosine--tRNA ligase [SAR116 cluster bacterium]RPH07464.1 MAG: tyrosine--tRNA ligase [Alphaproteobacteria bacterium TMED54]